MRYENNECGRRSGVIDPRNARYVNVTVERVAPEQSSTDPSRRAANGPVFRSPPFSTLDLMCKLNFYFFYNPFLCVSGQFTPRSTSLLIQSSESTCAFRVPSPFIYFPSLPVKRTTLLPVRR